MKPVVTESSIHNLTQDATLRSRAVNAEKDRRARLSGVLARVEIPADYTFVSPAHSSEWRRFVEGCGSSLFHSPQWARVIEETYGLTTAACIMRRGDSDAAGVSWIDVDGIAGPRRVTLPFSDRCDILAGSPEDVAGLARQVMPDHMPWTIACVSGSPLPEASDAKLLRTARTQTVDLSPSTESLWANISSAARRGVRKSQKDGAETCLAQDKAQLRQWYMLHLRLRKHKHGVLPQPFAFFERIWDQFIEEQQGFLLLAMVDGEIAGGNLYLLWKDTLYYKFNASDISSLQARPNNLLMWRGMELAKEMGCKALDLGRTSNGQDGLFRFKESFGAYSQDLRTVAFGMSPELEARSTQARSTLDAITARLADPSLPDEVTEAAGQLLYRNFV